MLTRRRAGDYHDAGRYLREAGPLAGRLGGSSGRGGVQTAPASCLAAPYLYALKGETEIRYGLWAGIRESPVSNQEEDALRRVCAGPRAREEDDRNRSRSTGYADVQGERPSDSDE
jgi:hypothetical protein